MLTRTAIVVKKMKLKLGLIGEDKVNCACIEMSDSLSTDANTV